MRNHWTSEIYLERNLLASRPFLRFTTVTAYYTTRYTVPPCKRTFPRVGEIADFKAPFSQFSRMQRKTKNHYLERLRGEQRVFID